MDTNIQVYGKRDDISELAYRISKMAVGSNRLDENQALALAQIATAHGLDPFNGECWFIPGSGLMVGIKGLRKLARQQAIRENCTFWTEEAYVLPELYGASKDAVVYTCTIRDTNSMQAYGKSINILTTSGVPYKDAVDMIGKAPAWVGVGISTPDEKSKMGIHARARKRAEADALKKRFDVEFAGVDVPVVIEGDNEFVDAEHVTVTSYTNNGHKPEAQILAELGFDTPKPTKAQVNSDLGYSQFEPTATMSLETAEDVTNSEDVRYGDLPTDKLSYMANSLAKKLAANGLTAEMRETVQMKLDAARVILASRAA